MDALILAAGMGTRLREVEPCKPLTRLHGFSLLEIAVQQLALAGARRVRVATGYHAEQVEAALPELARRAGVAVEARRVPDFRLPNGHSVLAGAAGFAGDFLLVMADHVLSYAILRDLAACPLDGMGAVLAVDRRITSPLIDPDDATWVAVDEAGRIDRIGKALRQYDAVDCGAFRASPALLDAITAAIAAGQPGSLSDGMQRLADLRRAGTVDIGDAWWIDVDDPRALALAAQQAAGHLPHLFDLAEAGAGLSTAA
jgi:1L-myo-inositol 1-phosphate cytidylyltransferase